MIIASAFLAKKVQFINGNMVVNTIHDEEKIIPNETMKYYAVEGMNIETEKSNNYIIKNENCNQRQKWKHSGL